MAICEFHWGVKPTIPDQWRSAVTHEGFEIEIAADSIEVRKAEDGQQDAQLRQAQAIVEGILRGIGLAEQTRYAATLGSVTRFDPNLNRRDIAVHLSAGLTMKASLDAVLVSADGVVTADTRKDRIHALLRLAESCTKNATLRRMCDYLLDYHADPGKKLAPLFDIIELAAKAFGDRKKAAASLSLRARQVNDAVTVMNDPTVRTARHRGQELQRQRDATAEEVALCETLAQDIVDRYAKCVENGTAPA